jgi:hypothetical protein
MIEREKLARRVVWLALNFDGVYPALDAFRRKSILDEVGI